MPLTARKPAATPLNELTATEIVRAVTDGTTTCEAVARAHLEHIAAREPQVQAWQYLDPEYVMTQARALDKRTPRGPLHGVPFAIKDIIDTCDMPTEYGSPIHAGHRPDADAACVALGRRAGGLLMGKTVTTEFANQTPGKTRNPFDPARTPGGSSSGSAAAVADHMAALAIGTQTTGSTIRPAYITATRWQTSDTTPKSWVMNSSEAPRCSRSWSSSFRTCAWTVTSSAVVGSSATSSAGSLASAMAMETRWRMPPDSSCG